MGVHGVHTLLLLLLSAVAVMLLRVIDFAKDFENCVLGLVNKSTELILNRSALIEHTL